MSWKIEIKDKAEVFDAIGEGIKRDIFDLGIYDVEDVKFIQIYIIKDSITPDDVKKICEEVLLDSVSQEYSFSKTSQINNSFGNNTHVVEVAYNPGVMDPVEESSLKAIRDIGISAVTSIKTAKKYIIKGRLNNHQLKIICDKLLYNKLIQHIVPRMAEDKIPAEVKYQFRLVTVGLLKAGDKKLMQLSKSGQLFLNINEMRAIKDYFRKLKRDPTDCELETIAQTWSEHCWHKTFRGKIDYKQSTVNGALCTKKIDNLLKSTIMKVTKELNKPWCVSVFKDNSGVIKFDDDYNICFKVETHNHPSALEPFGGANTGVGGVIRDPLGTGMGAKPILNTDVFCFASPDYPFSKLPAGTLHPKRVMKGVVSGVRDYGNKMGIPTVNGAILFHDRFVGNPLVYCGTVGIMPKDKAFKNPRKGDLIVVVGGRTGRDGIHGATFSSGELTHESETISSGAVQIGNPIQEKKMVDTILKARDRGLYSAITDCGAGGLSSAVGEMGQDLGAVVYLDKVPLKYSGLSYMEIWISESQERMVLSVPKENIAELIDVFTKENVEAAVIGEFPGDDKLRLYYNDKKVCELEMGFLHEGLPKIEKKAVFKQHIYREPKLRCPKDVTKTLKQLLSHYDICSKEWVIRQYDHEVQGGSVVKPLIGKFNDGPADASVNRPLLNSNRGIILSNGINFRFGLIDPYWMAASCIDEALRQIIAVGGSLGRVALLDNFCWGNPDKPDRLGGLVRAALGCYDIAKGFGLPFISGKDSLYNEFTVNKRSISIPGTLLISAIAVMQDVSKAVSMYLKKPGNLVYIVGETFNELGGSHYYDILGYVGNTVPKVDVIKAKKTFVALSKAASSGLVESIHDCSDGGLAVSCAEMSFAGNLGMRVFLSEAPFNNSKARLSNDCVLFSESNSRFIVEVSRENQKAFEKTLKGIVYGLIGCVTKEGILEVHGLDGKTCIRASVDELKTAWKEPLQW
ncbi:MAG: phosphoribosylformylglycinamidine synthase subunit PurL [Candidatus Omnitrophota bacterium]|jgi:phosphoribosylformylglycinamidine synthase|nr:MAG: phosphoribosylformylglycinamidine synthase subunit PurL [Candidatus Omnitrophota bacterium]